VLYQIVRAVRAAVPAHQVVSAKMRLGFNDDSTAEECALALEAGGASEIVVHARTKADAYRPPAYWHRIADIKAKVKTPLVANGEIWHVQDALNARAESGCFDLMLGRGIVTNPGLGWAIKAHDAASQGLPNATSEVRWQDVQPHLHTFWQIVSGHVSERHQAGRLKQWLNFLRKHYPEAEAAYTHVRTLTSPKDINAWFSARARAHV
jgi:tRNA-dihydrouridine synthase C